MSRSLRVWALLLPLVASLAGAAEGAPPATGVKGRVVCETLGRAPNDVWVTVYALPSGRGLRRTSWTDGTFSIPLKPGKYRLELRGVEVYPTSVDVTVPESGEADLGEIAMEPTVLAWHYGKAPPKWTVTEARGTAPDAPLAGRWTVLLFWGYW